eukprot:scaffold547878_cov48-Prasinocladus_malaysianus.AAC.1
MARALADCRKQYEGDCEGRCGRHVCVEGVCRCPVYFSGDPMCSSVSSAANTIHYCAVKHKHSTIQTAKDRQPHRSP